MAKFGANCHVAKHSCQFKCQDKATAPVTCATVGTKQGRPVRSISIQKKSPFEDRTTNTPNNLEILGNIRKRGALITLVKFSDRSKEIRHHKINLEN